MGQFISAPWADTAQREHQKNDSTQTRSKTGNTPPPRPPALLRRSNSTENMADNIERHLTDLTESVRTLKGGKSSERKTQLLNMLAETEIDLHKLNQQVQPTKIKGGKSTFFTSLGGGEEILQDVLSANEILNEKIDDMKANVEAVKKQNKKLRKENETLKKNAEKTEDENTELLLRLSTLAGNKLVENNPAIADLNDRNRPTKLGEIYSEIYDNEWTDAFEALKAEGYDEEFTIGTLQLTLINIFDFCKQTSESMLLKTEDAVNFLFKEYKLLEETMTVSQHMKMTKKRVSSLKLPTPLQNDLQLQERWRRLSPKNDSHELSVGTLKVEKSDKNKSHIKALRKEIAESMVPVAQKAYTSATWIDGEFVPELKPFIRKCTFLCWMMVVQTPPMTFHIVDANNDSFDKSMFKEYTTSGPFIKFVVWPALLLNENGPIISKGVAQGCDKDKDMSGLDLKR